MNYRIHKKLNEITKSLIQYHLHLNKSCNHITKVNFCLLFSIFSESLLISFYVHSLQIWSIIFHTCVMSFRSGNHLLVVLQLSTPVLLPQQLQLLGDVKWGNSVTKRQTNKQKGKKRTNKQTSRVANWTICPNICYCLRRTVTYQNMDLWWLFFRHQLKILRNIDSHMSHVETSNKVLTSSKHLNYWCWSFFLWLLLRRTVLIIDWPLEKSIDYWRSGEIQLCHYHRALLRCRSCRVRSQLERTGFYWKLWGRWIALFFF